MSTSYGHYTSGWCGSCGRKRGPDGRCENCDPWWTSPLIQYGGPLVAGVTLILLVGSSLVRVQPRDGRDGYIPRAAAPALAANTPRFVNPGSPSPYGYRPVAAPVSASFGASIPIMNVSPADANRPTFDELQRRDHEDLRRMTAYVDSAIRADDFARADRGRASAVSAYAPAYATPRPMASAETSAATAAL